MRTGGSWPAPPPCSVHVALGGALAVTHDERLFKEMIHSTGWPTRPRRQGHVHGLGRAIGSAEGDPRGALEGPPPGGGFLSTFAIASRGRIAGDAPALGIAWRPDPGPGRGGGPLPLDPSPGADVVAILMGRFHALRKRWPGCPVTLAYQGETAHTEDKNRKEPRVFSWIWLLCH
jgi:hypothetical protein